MGPRSKRAFEEWAFLDNIGNIASTGWHAIADPISKEISDVGKRPKQQGVLFTMTF
jgi:hypothetical protein